jgi:hypothetical protein
MAFREVFAAVTCLAVALAAPAPQAAFLQPTFAAQPTFVNALPQVIAQSPLSHAAAVRTVVAQGTPLVAQPAVQTIQTVNQPIVQAVRAIPAAVPNFVTQEVVETVDPNPQYSFGYSVADSLSGDSKTREESRDGDKVTGSYSVADPDGRIRRVDYTADKEHGFQATVTYDGQTGPVAIPFNAPVSSVSSAAAVPSVSNAAVVAKEPETVQVIDARENQEAVKKTSATAAAAPAATTVLRTVPAVQSFSPAFVSAEPQLLRTAQVPQAFAAAPQAFATGPQQFVTLADGQTIELRAVPANNGFFSGFQTIDGAHLVQG